MPKLRVLAKKYLKLISRNKAYVVGGVVLFLVGLIVSYLYFTLSKVFVHLPTPTPFATSALATPTPTKAPDAPINVLLLGYGGGTHEGTNLTDTIIVARVDPKTHTIGLISVPRDLWVPIHINTDKLLTDKVNMAFALGLDDTVEGKNPSYSGWAGAGALAKQTVSAIVGLPIDYFVAVDFASFIKGVDILGGIDVVVPSTFDDEFYPIEGKEEEICDKTPEEVAQLGKRYTGFELEKQFSCRFEHIHFDKGTSHMDGATALKFVRSRHSNTNGGDYARSERQAAVIDAIRHKALSLGIFTKLIPLINTLSDSVRTDFDPSTIFDYSAKVGDPGSYRTYSIRLTEDNILVHKTSVTRQFILVPKTGDTDWDSIHTFITDEIAKQTQLDQMSAE